MNRLHCRCVCQYTVIGEAERYLNEWNITVTCIKTSILQSCPDTDYVWFTMWRLSEETDRSSFSEICNLCRVCWCPVCGHLVLQTWFIYFGRGFDILVILVSILLTVVYCVYGNTYDMYNDVYNPNINSFLEYFKMFSTFSYHGCWDLNLLTHWGRDKMAAIFRTTFSNRFSWMKIYQLWLSFHWSLFLWVQLIIFQHWFRYWLGVDQATSHYLNQLWLVYWLIYPSLSLNELTLWNLNKMADNILMPFLDGKCQHCDWNLFLRV